MFGIIFTKIPESVAKFEFISYKDFVELKSEMRWQVSPEIYPFVGNFTFLCDVYNVRGKIEVFISYDS